MLRCTQNICVSLQAFKDLNFAAQAFAGRMARGRRRPGSPPIPRKQKRRGGQHRRGALRRGESNYSAAATASAFSTLAAQNLNSGIFPNGSSAGFVSRLAAASE